MANHDAIVLPSLLEETERSRSAGSDASDITPVAEMASREHIQPFRLTSYVSSGRTWDVYETSVPGVLAKVCCPDTDSLYPPFDRYGEGYEDGEDAHNSRREQLIKSIENEAALFLNLEDTGYVPRVGGLWAGAVEKSPGRWWHLLVMLLEDVRGDSGGSVSLRAWSELNDSMRYVIQCFFTVANCMFKSQFPSDKLAEAYRALHAMGVLHGDIEPRHVFPNQTGLSS